MFRIVYLCFDNQLKNTKFETYATVMNIRLQKKMCYVRDICPAVSIFPLAIIYTTPGGVDQDDKFDLEFFIYQKDCPFITKKSALFRSNSKVNISTTTFVHAITTVLQEG